MNANGAGEASRQESLESRLHRLEAIEAIKQLKARYLSACDRKQVDVIRDCFADGPVTIDYGPIGRFEHRDGLIDAFERLGNHDFIVDMHHGQNPQIEILSPDSARGSWQLYFHQINKRENQVTQLGDFTRTGTCVSTGVGLSAVPSLRFHPVAPYC
ncbi:nuclear transport factor 2 family protein [Microbulbifer taiwanensis]|uniref:nuclear transport factor 2 family protein n=1 Tax=Microbulbifer taiwanensis TaxID=986746 RepID=UPI003614874C